MNLPKLVLLRPKEFKIIRKLLKRAGKNNYIKDCLIRNSGECSCINCDYIKEDGILEWSMLMTSQILKSNSKIKKHNLGHRFDE